MGTMVRASKVGQMSWIRLCKLSRHEMNCPLLLNGLSRLNVTNWANQIELLDGEKQMGQAS